MSASREPALVATVHTSSCGTPATEEVPHSRWSLDPFPADADDLSRREATLSVLWSRMRVPDHLTNRFFFESPTTMPSLR